MLQYLLMRNKRLHSVDFTESIDDSRSHFMQFFSKFDQHSKVRYLTLDSLLPDLSNSIESLGKALGENRIIETLHLGNNRIRANAYCNFWVSLKTNTSLRKINVSKTDLGDKVSEKLAEYLE